MPVSTEKWTEVFKNWLGPGLGQEMYKMKRKYLVTHQQGATKDYQGPSNPRSQCKEAPIDPEWTSWTLTMLKLMDKSISHILKHMSCIMLWTETTRYAQQVENQLVVLGMGSKGKESSIIQPSMHEVSVYQVTKCYTKRRVSLCEWAN